MIASSTFTNSSESMAPRPLPSFFKILLDPSAPHLPLPPDFVTNHLENKIPRDSIIRSVYGGYSWRLKIKQIGETYCFSHGWINVVRDIQLGFGDFLIFRVAEKSSFRMLVYSPNGCEKVLPPKIKVEELDDDVVVDDDVVDDVVDEDDEEEDEDEDEDEEEEEDDVDDDVDVDDDEEDDEKEDDDDGDIAIDGDDGDPFFTSIISKAPKILRLPTEFVELAGIDTEKTIMLKNLDGDEWRMGLKSERINQAKRYYLSSGWLDFQKNNNLSEGDECVFTFIRNESKLCLAKVTNKKRPSSRQLPEPRRPEEIPATEIEKRKGGGEDVENEGEQVETVKRPRGRPRKRPRGGVV